MRFLLTLLLVTAGLSAGSPIATAHPGLSWKAVNSPFSLDFQRGGRALTGQRETSYRIADGTSHSLTKVVGQHRIPGGVRYVVATTEASRTASVAVTRTERGLRVGWTLEPSLGVAQVSVNLTGSLEEHFLGGGAHTMFVDLQRRVLLNKAVFVGASTFGKCNKNGAPSTFFMSSAGYGVFADTKAIGRTAFPGAVADDHCADKPAPCPVAFGVPDRIQLCFKTSRLDYEVYAGSPEQVNSAYFKRVGTPTLPPARQFALTKWRDKYNHSDEIVEDVTQFQQRGVPLDTLWVDNPWEQGPEGARPTVRVHRRVEVRQDDVPGRAGHDRLDEVARREPRRVGGAVPGEGRRTASPARTTTPRARSHSPTAPTCGTSTSRTRWRAPTTRHGSKPCSGWA